MVLKLQNSKKFLGSVFDLPGDDIDPNKNQSPEWLEGFCSFVGLKCFGDAFAVAFRSLEEKTCWIHSITHSKNLITCGTYAFDSRWLLMTCQWLVYITSSLRQLFCQIFPSTCTTAGAAVTCTTGRTGGAYAERPVETTGPRLGVQLLCPMIKIGRTLANYANCPVYKNGEKLWFSTLMDNCFKKVPCGLAARNPLPCPRLFCLFRAPDVATGFCTGLPTPTKSTNFTNNIHSFIGVKKSTIHSSNCPLAFLTLKRCLCGNCNVDKEVMCLYICGYFKLCSKVILPNRTNLM